MDFFCRTLESVFFTILKCRIFIKPCKNGERRIREEKRAYDESLICVYRFNNMTHLVKMQFINVIILVIRFMVEHLISLSNLPLKKKNNVKINNNNNAEVISDRLCTFDT